MLIYCYHSVHLFAYECPVYFEDTNQTMPGLVRRGELTALSDVSLDYNTNTQVHGLRCAKPLFTSYLLNYITPDINAPYAPIMDIWKLLPKVVWVCIILSFCVMILLDTVAHKTSLFNNLFIYYKPMLLIGEHTRRYRYNAVYILWLMAITPVVYIVQNQLTAQMVTRDVITVDTMDDLFDPR